MLTWLPVRPNPRVFQSLDTRREKPAGQGNTVALLLQAHRLCHPCLAPLIARTARLCPHSTSSHKLSSAGPKGCAARHRVALLCCTAAWAAPGPNRWYNPASQHGSQLHSGSDGAAGLAQARLLPDVGIAWLALSQRPRVADDSGHQNSHVPTSSSVCSALLESWDCCCRHLEVRLGRMWLAC